MLLNETIQGYDRTETVIREENQCSFEISEVCSPKIKGKITWNLLNTCASLVCNQVKSRKRL